MFRRSRYFVAWLAVVSLSSVIARGQDPAAKEPATETAEAPAAPGGYAELRKKWEEMNDKAKKLINDFRSAKEQDKKAIRDQFQALNAEHEQVVQQLRAAATAEFEKDPKKNTEAAQWLADLAGDYVRRDRYEEALAILKPLLDKNSDAEGVSSTAGLAAFSLDDFDSAEKYFAEAKAKGGLDPDASRYADILKDEKQKWLHEQELRAQDAKADDLPRVRLTTTKGDLVIELFENEAPNTVANFISLVEKDYYNGLAFHRVLSGFMAQGGDPKGDGTGGPGYTIECECDEPGARMHFRGTLSMAHAGKDTGGSQFFLTFRPTPHLDKQHTAFGRVVEGMDVLAKLTRRDPSGFGRLPDADKIVKAEVIRKREHEYTPVTHAEENPQP